MTYLEHNTRDGLHMAALAGNWIALIAGIAGMRDQADRLSLAPRLPARLSRLAFTLSARQRHLSVEVNPKAAAYTLKDGEPLEFFHHGQAVTAVAGSPLICTIPAAPTLTAPLQPTGREPAHRSKVPPASAT